MEGVDARVLEVEDVGGDNFVVVTEPPFDAEPGQFVQVGLEIDGAEVVRHYTLSSPHPSERFEFTVEEDPEGELTPELVRLDAGDTVRVDGPFGRSYYEGEDAVTVLGGGPGVGPAVGIAERALDDGGSAAVVYEDDEPAHLDRLRRLEDEGATVELVEAGGDLSDVVRGALEDVGGQVFVYGFSEFVDRALDAVDSFGGPKDADEAGGRAKEAGGTGPGPVGEPKVERFD